MRIAICEDLENERKNLYALLSAELDSRKIDGEIFVFKSGEEMLEAMKEEVFDINFLDIYMDKVTGMEVAGEIRTRDEFAAIVFTTTSLEHMADGFSVGAIHYLVKPYTKKDASIALDRCLHIVGMPEKFIEVNVGGDKRKLLLKQILWAEAQNKSCVIRLPDESVRIYIKLNELLNMLNDVQFLHCHRSYVVNLDHVSGVKGNDFLMRDGAIVPIRREDKVKFKQTLQNYNFKKLRGGSGNA